MSNKELDYKKHNSTSLVVYGDRDKHQKFIRSIDGRWNSKIKNSEPGWLVPIEKEKALKEYIKKLTITTLNSNVKSRKSQKKYHRAISISSSDDDEESLDSDDSAIVMPKISPREKEKVVKEPKKERKRSSSSSYEDDFLNKKMEEKLKFEKEKEEFEKTNKKDTEHRDDHVSYYKSFNQKPTTFKKVNNYVLPESEEERYSSSERSGSSSEDSFPEPKTPKKRKKYGYHEDKNENYDDLFKEMKSMQRQIYEMQIENKKLKSKNLNDRK